MTKFSSVDLFHPFDHPFGQQFSTANKQGANPVLYVTLGHPVGMFQPEAASAL